MFIQIKPNKTPHAARAFLNAVHRAAPFAVCTLLTYTATSSPTGCSDNAQVGLGQHEFDATCDTLGIEHRRKRSRTSQTSGKVKRCDGRLEQLRSYP